MSVAGVNATTTTAYDAYDSKAKTTAKTEEPKKDTAASEGGVYEKSSAASTKTTYSNNKVSSEKRAQIVEQMKADQAKRQQQMADIVKQMMGKQADKYAQANDDMWKFLAKGNFTVDAETKKQAQADIAEDGYYGVNKTAQRIFDFASALAGDDVEKMKKMQAAFEKGYGQAAKAWGGDLPGISGQTRDAVNKMFDDYYDSKNTFTD